MIPISIIKSNYDEVKKSLAKRGAKYIEFLDEALKIDKSRRETQLERDLVLSNANKLAKEIGVCFKNGEAQKANELKLESAELKEKSKALDDSLKQFENKLREVLSSIPNMPYEIVPEGNSENDNEIVRTWGEEPKGDEALLCHWEVTEKYDIIDFETGTKIAGAGFPLYKGKGAKLQRALINYFLDKATSNGYTEMQPPILINEDSGFGTGQLPDKEGQMYFVEKDNLYLIPTAEVPVTNIYRNSIINESDLPIRMTAYTPCFRREAGSYGKHVRGLNRLHQFDKVEIVEIVKPETSYETLDNMCSYVSGILEELGLYHRVLRLCAGDLGFTSACTYDMEVYSAAQKRWLEVSSVSNFESYQSNRLQVRFKDNKTNKKELVHTLNGSALALPRIVAAILENNQTEKGIFIPEILQKYTGFDYIN